MQATSFSCTALEETVSYYNYDTWNNGTPTLASTPGNMDYYIKQTSANNQIMKNEVCGIFAGEEICAMLNPTPFRSAGATCQTIEFGGRPPTYLSVACTLNNVYCNVDVEGT